MSFPLPAVLSICTGLASALAYLHAQQLCHGDVYAHNILYCPDSQHAVLCDFGASFRYHPGQVFFEFMEVRACARVGGGALVELCWSGMQDCNVCLVWALVLAVFQTGCLFRAVMRSKLWTDCY